MEHHRSLADHVSSQYQQNAFTMCGSLRFLPHVDAYLQGSIGGVLAQVLFLFISMQARRAHDKSRPDYLGTVKFKTLQARLCGFTVPRLRFGIGSKNEPKQVFDAAASFFLFFSLYPFRSLLFTFRGHRNTKYYPKVQHSMQVKEIMCIQETQKNQHKRCSTCSGKQIKFRIIFACGLCIDDARLPWTARRPSCCCFSVTSLENCATPSSMRNISIKNGCDASQGRRANKKAVKDEYNRLSDPGYAAKMRTKEKEEVRWSRQGILPDTCLVYVKVSFCGVLYLVVLSRGELRRVCSKSSC